MHLDNFKIIGFESTISYKDLKVFIANSSPETRLQYLNLDIYIRSAIDLSLKDFLDNNKSYNASDIKIEISKKLDYLSKLDLLNLDLITSEILDNRNPSYYLNEDFLDIKLREALSIYYS